MAGRCPCLRHRAERRPQGGCHRGCRLHLVAAIGEALGGASGQPAARSHILVLNRVLMLGSQAQTVIGRPILPDAVVHAVVEEHVLTTL
uniref:Uncharacterized protein n=1 Tax=Zea mays TaxID=4577 RepID=A0A804NJV6_MAIZE